MTGFDWFLLYMAAAVWGLWWLIDGTQNEEDDDA